MTNRSSSDHRPFREFASALPRALEALPLPVFITDRHGVLRWLNLAALELVGPAVGRRFTRTIAPEKINGARAEFAEKMLGRKDVSRFSTAFITPSGQRVPVEVVAVSLHRLGSPIGALTLALPLDAAGSAAKVSLPTPELTPRQHDVLRLLSQGRTTDEIAAQLGIAQETARNHIRRLLRELRVHTRLEAVTVAFRNGWL